jgi:hypothetical protein
MYVAFKCFMLHVFHVVRRVRRRGRVMVARHGCQGMGSGEPVVGGRGARHAGDGGRGHDGAGARMVASRNEADGADCERVIRTRRQHYVHAGRADSAGARGKRRPTESYPSSVRVPARPKSEPMTAIGP